MTLNPPWCIAVTLESKNWSLIKIYGLWKKSFLKSSFILLMVFAVQFKRDLLNVFAIAAGWEALDCPKATDLGCTSHVVPSAPPLVTSVLLFPEFPFLVPAHNHLVGGVGGRKPTLRFLMCSYWPLWSVDILTFYSSSAKPPVSFLLGTTC